MLLEILNEKNLYLNIGLPDLIKRAYFGNSGNIGG